MKDLIQCTTSHRNFQRWLDCGSYPITFLDREDNPVCPLIQLEKSKQVTYLYHAILRDSSITWDYAPQFIGAYHRMNRSLYLTRGFLESDECARAELAHTKAENSLSVKDEIVTKINQYVERAIGGSRKNLYVSEVTDEYLSSDLAEYLEYAAESEAEDLFLTGQEPNGQFHSEYAIKELTESTFLAYIQNPEQFIQMESARYMEDDQEVFLLQFLKSDALRAAYQALLQDVSNPLHTMKAISDAVKEARAETVNVTIQRNGQELTFAADAHSLTGQHNYYSTTGLVNADRREFEKTFGCMPGYTAKEITQITYNGNTIYEAPSEQIIDVTQNNGMEGIT